MDSAKTAAIKNRYEGKTGGASLRSTFAKFSCVSAAKRLAEEEKGQSVFREGVCSLTVCLRRLTAFSPLRGSKKRLIRKLFLKMRLNGVYFRRMQKRNAVRGRNSDCVFKLFKTRLNERFYFFFFSSSALRASSSALRAR